MEYKIMFKRSGAIWYEKFCATESEAFELATELVRTGASMVEIWRQREVGWSLVVRCSKN